MNKMPMVVAPVLATLGVVSVGLVLSCESRTSVLKDLSKAGSELVAYDGAGEKVKVSCWSRQLEIDRLKFSCIGDLSVLAVDNPQLRRLQEIDFSDAEILREKEFDFDRHFFPIVSGRVKTSQ